jgi:hypothetical protein
MQVDLVVLVAVVDIYYQELQVEEPEHLVHQDKGMMVDHRQELQLLIVEEVVVLVV